MAYRRGRSSSIPVDGVRLEDLLSKTLDAVSYFPSSTQTNHVLLPSIERQLLPS